MRWLSHLLGALTLGPALVGCTIPEKLTFQNAPQRFAEITPGMTKSMIEERIGRGRTSNTQTLSARVAGLTGQRAEDFNWAAWAVGDVQEALVIGFNKDTGQAAIILRDHANADVAVPGPSIERR